ncbi:MAG: hypothetical protein HRU20_32040 [Pseudomonadales bacterium]|nr:hypothetical protein [Pseudomonadales bacterium]
MAIQTLALNLQYDTSGDLPSWLMLVPAGHIQGRDNRSWINDQPEAVIAYNRALDRDIVFDFEHATHLKASKGELAPASGWIKISEIEVRDGAIWGRVDWNETGRSALERKEYRYYSPAFLYDANSDRITGIHHIALTNRHNLFDLPALNNQLPHEEKPMALAAALALALGLNAETATDDDAVTAINSIKTEKNTLALNAEQFKAGKVVPIETHNLALNRAEEAEGKILSMNQEGLKNKSEALINQAVEDKKIAPANRDHFLGLCSDDAGYTQVEALLGKAPKIIADDTNLDGKKAVPENVALNTEQETMANAFGNSAEDLNKHS